MLFVLVGALACDASHVTAPLVSETTYALATLNGRALPVTLVQDFDVRVELVRDEVVLRGDSTFMRVSTYRGTAAPIILDAADTVRGHYSVRDTVVTFLLPDWFSAQMTLTGTTLVQKTATRTYMFSRVP